MTEIEELEQMLRKTMEAVERLQLLMKRLAESGVLKPEDEAIVELEQCIKQAERSVRVYVDRNNDKAVFFEDRARKLRGMLDELKAALV